MVKGPTHPSVRTAEGLYVLIGRDDFLKREFVENVRKSLFPSAQNPFAHYAEFDLKQDPLYKLFDFLDSSSFLSEKKLAVLRQVEELSGEESKKLIRKAETLPAGTTLILVSSETSTRGALVQSLSRIGRVVTCHTPFDKDLPSWIATRAKKWELLLEREAIVLLVEKVGKDLAALNMSLETLSVYIYPRKRITAKDIEDFLGKSAETDVFRLVDLLVEKNMPAALRALESVLKEGARAYEIIPVLANQLERLKRAAELIEKGSPPAEIGAQLKVHSFFLDKFVRQARLVGRDKASKILSELLKCDELVKKSGLNDRVALEKCVLAIGMTA